MRKLFSALALTVAFAMPAAAATIDFTADNATSGTVLGSIGWSVMASPGTLTNATHWNNVGCSTFVCAAVGNRFDVGFGVQGANNNEIDGKIGVNEYVQVTFSSAVKVTGFAGMLTYANTVLTGAREQVVLEYFAAGVWTALTAADPLFVVNQGNGNFDTVGLALRDGFSVITDRVRFSADGVGTSDDGSFNVTAAGLQVSAVPVPAAGFLLLGALGGIAALRRRRKAA